jgi:transposase
MADGRSAAGERTQTNGQARALVLTGPEDLRARFTGHTAAALVAELASLRPRPGSTVGYATRIALRELGRRAEFPGGQLGRLDELIGPLVAARAPGFSPSTGSGLTPRRCCLPRPGITRNGCAARPPGRRRSDPGSSGKTVRRRHGPGGDRQANHALWRIVFTAWALTRLSAPTSNAAQPEENPKRKSSAA